MKILMAASEMDPFARTGGLADVTASLPHALESLGHETSVVIPCYRGIADEYGAQPAGLELEIPMGAGMARGSILETTAPNGTQVFFVRNDDFFDRPGLYGEDGTDYPDNAARFIFFSKAVVELAHRLQPQPDILHLHDWQTALAALLARNTRLSARSVLTIHNLAFQGAFRGSDFALTNLPGSYFHADSLEYFGTINLLKGGICAAHRITTVSETYAQEILTPEGGCGLDGVLRARKEDFRGILNGADYDVWDPATDPLIPRRYGADAPAGKAACRTRLLAECGLDPKPTGPIYTMVSRLSEQKGFDLLLPIMDRLLADDVRLLILGAGDPQYATELALATRRHSGRLCFREMYDAPLAHLAVAGADIGLFPSRFEPCGLSALYDLKYGTIPVARAVGGFHQFLRDYDPAAGDGWAFLFHDYDAEALWDAMRRAAKVFRSKDRWRGLTEQAMRLDFSWHKTAPAYNVLYRELSAAD